MCRPLFCTHGLKVNGLVTTRKMELNGTKWDSEGVGNYYNQYYKLECSPQDECWDIDMEGEREDEGCGQDTWSNWRGTNVCDDCEHETIEKDIFSDHDYVW